MAAIAPAADQTTELLQKLSLDPQTKNHDATDITKKPSGLPYGPASNADAASVPVHLSDRATTPVLPDFVDPSMCYVQNAYPSQGFYYAGYDGVVEWDDYPRYEGMEGVYSDMYHGGYGYHPYGPYPASPVPAMGHDVQLYSHQHYQYPASYYPPSAPVNCTPAPAKPPTSQSEVSASVAAVQPPLSGDSLKASSNGVANANVSNGTVPAKSNLKNSSVTTNGTYGRGAPPGAVPSGYHDPRFGYDGIRSPVSWLDGPIFPDGHNRLQSANTITPSISHVGNISSGRNQNMRPFHHHMGSFPQAPTSGMGPVGHGYVNRMFPNNNRFYGQFGNAIRNGQGYGPNGFGYQSNGRGWPVIDNKFKVRGRGNGFHAYGNENMEGLNELNKGPRSGRFKINQKSAGSNVVAVKGQNLPSFASNEDSSLVPDKDQYNRADFPEEYSDAKFFVIKSYSEDDVHKSVKYNVWASTPNGNKKLDAAYREAKEKTIHCPIFLLFSVNTSGQFVGVAEMVGPVDFNKTVDYWQQDKWNGCFPVKWHIVKDVPNSILKHITLENNENKPVTNSRDTQEVKFEHGIQMLLLFKEHVSKTSILDDFCFYEARQKTMQERRAKQQFQKQVWDGKVAPTLTEVKGKDDPNSDRPQKSLEPVLAVDNAASAACTESPKLLQSTTEKGILPNGDTENATNGF